MKKYDAEKVKEATRLLLEGIGDDPNRDGLKETPNRVAKMYAKIMNGYDDGDEKIASLVKVFDEKTTGDMVMVKDIPFYSYCEHHLQPFVGKLAIAYIPTDNKVLGLSKLVRLARVFAKRPQVQERLTKQIVEAIHKYVPNDGVAIKLEAEHMCMSIRGVRTPGTKTITYKMTGKFNKPKSREEFLEALR